MMDVIMGLKEMDNDHKTVYAYHSHATNEFEN